MKKICVIPALAVLAACSHAPAKLQNINNHVNNEIVYTSDLAQYGKRDFAIAYPVSQKGDCEDYALQKMLELEKQGQPLASMAIEICTDTKPAHAYLTVREGDSTFYLDNMTNAIWDVSPCKTRPFQYSGTEIKKYMRQTPEGLVWNRTLHFAVKQLAAGGKR